MNTDLLSARPFFARIEGIRRASAGLAAVIVGVGVLVVAEPDAMAIPGCTSTAPALNVQVTCSLAGFTSVAVPAGAGVINVVVTGAGGGGGRFSSVAGNGGAGAVLSGAVSLPAGTATVRVAVGAAGAAGVNGPASAGGAGRGGGGSALFAYDSGNALITTLAIAAGGGGGGGCDVCNPPYTLTARGGNAGAGGAAGGQPGLIGGGGSAATGAVGGSAPGGQAPGSGAGNITIAGNAGGNAVSGTVALGGLPGLVVGYLHAGSGGGGYAGGGSGGVFQVTYGSQYEGGGGGGGSSYANSSYFPSAVSSLATSGAGAPGGGATGPAVCGVDCPATPGATGAVSMSFDLPPVPTLTSTSPLSGPLGGGGNLVITGSGFTGASAVTVGGTPCASYIVDTATQITCVLPPGTVGAADVAVTAPGGSITLPSAYTYLAASAISSVSPIAGPTAGGGTLVITGSNFTGTTQVSIGEMNCVSFTVDSPTQISCIIPSGSLGNYTVAVFTPAGVATLPAGYAYANAPTAPLNLAATPGNAAATLTFNVPASDGGSAITGYESSIDGGATWAPLTTSTAGSSVTATRSGLVNSSAYQLQVRAVNAVGAGPATTGVSVTPVSLAPATPAPPVAVAGVSSASVSWAQSTSVGVTGYTVTAHPAPSTCTTTSANLTSCLMGLTAGISYTFTVVAHSADADSAASASSNAVVPTAPSVQASAPLDAPTTLTTTDGVLARVYPAQPVTVVGTGFAAYSTAKVIIYSSPILLATVTTDGRGNFTAPVIVPSGLEAGDHNFVASGIDPAGHARQLRMPVTVSVAPSHRNPVITNLVAAGTNLVVTFTPASPAAGSRVRRYQVSTDAGRSWRSVTVSGSQHLRATITGLHGGATYRVEVRATTTAGITLTSVSVRISLPRAWYYDPLTTSAREQETATPADPAHYRGPVMATSSTYRSYNDTVAVPVSWTRGHQLLAHQAATLTGDALFAFDSPVITAAGTAQLRALASSLKTAKSLTCEGYTDYGGKIAHQNELSQQRAEAVCAALRSFGVQAHMTAIGYGAARPVIVGGQPVHRAQNRRVVLYIAG